MSNQTAPGLDRVTLPATDILPETTVEVAQASLSPGDDLFFIRGDENMVRRLLHNPIELVRVAISTIGNDFPAAGRGDVTVLFSYPDENSQREVEVLESNGVQVRYTIEGVKKTGILTVRAHRLPGQNQEASSRFYSYFGENWFLNSSLHIREGADDGTVFAHFHIGENDQEMRDRVTAIALYPDLFLKEISDPTKVKQVEVVQGQEQEIPAQRRKKFKLPRQTTSTAALPTIRELRYLFHWVPRSEALAESKCCACNKLGGRQNANGEVFPDIFITTIYCPCPTG